ncbi:protein tyrosine phosphatase type IVA 2-like [Oscarella lobularis]|uniref:protein tyrosine phosphatase type IVA 2-like n=1 Tax=Oscarella lobularis TaxID=121494 RepID=UPI0033132B1D
MKHSENNDRGPHPARFSARGNGGAGGAQLGAPTFIDYQSMRFLITDRPQASNLSIYVEQLNKHNVKTLVRVCEPTYDTEKLIENGISVQDWAYDDGEGPPKKVIDDWLDLIDTWFRDKPGKCVAVHCVAGLGRAPVLVAIALMEAGMAYEDAVEFIRKKRRGAINAKQLSFLSTYRPRRKKKGKCTIQ